MDKIDVEIDNEEISVGKRIINGLKRIICLITPVAFAYLGYFTSPFIWELLNKGNNVPEGARFAISVIFFLIPTTFIFIDSRKLNPIIKITITDKKN